jgi:hypothetical protein
MNGLNWHGAIVWCVAVMATVAVAFVPKVQACNYDDVVGLNRGILNWVYPDSLHVSTAVWMAQAAGLIPRRQSSIGTQRLLGYHKAVSLLKRLNERLNRKENLTETPGFSLLFLDSMLWSRFAGSEVTVHVSGPRPGDAVIITEEPVISAILSGILTSRQARENGLIRIYGRTKNSALAKWLDYPLKSDR